MLYLQEQGAHVGRRSEHLVVTLDGRADQRVPIVSIRQVVVFGNVQVSTQALHTLAEAEVPVAFLSMYGKFIAAVVPAPPKNVALRAAQYQVFSDPSRALSLARAVVAAKIANQRTLLMRSLRSQPRAAATGDDPRIRVRCQPGPRQRRTGRARHGRDAGPGRRLPPTPASSWAWKARRPRSTSPTSAGCSRPRRPARRSISPRRNRRPPRDPVNSLLSFAYAMLAKDCFSAACTVGFDPYQGFYHAGRHGRPSLALDLMEEFRPVIADSVVLSLINNGMLVERGFPDLARRLPAHRRRPQDLFRGLRTAQGDRGDAPGLRLQDELRPDAGGPGPNAGRPRSRRHPALRRLHGPLRSE